MMKMLLAALMAVSVSGASEDSYPHLYVNFG